MKLTPLGDSAITISLAEERGSNPSDLLRRAWAVKAAVDKAGISGVIETVSSYESVSVFIDPLVPLAKGVLPLKVNEWFGEQLLAAASRAGKTPRLTDRPDEVSIPLCFDDEFALDLAEVAATVGIAPERLIERFCSVGYQVACVGFTPGFPYLFGLPPDLAVRRKATPRTVVPGGSVAIGGNQVGIYPVNSPGGWNVLGRTAVRLFDPENDPPSLLVAGDRVRFKRISREEFDSLHATPA